MTNEAIMVATHAAQIAGQVLPEASRGFDLTYFSSVVAVCISIIMIFFRYSGDKSKADSEKALAITGDNEAVLRKIQVLDDGVKDIIKDHNTLERDTSKETQASKDAVAVLRADIQVLKTQVETNLKSIDELKRDNKEILKKVDDLIKTFFEYLNK